MKFYQHCFVSPTSATTVLFPPLKSLYIFRDELIRALQLAIRLVGLMKFLWLLHQRQQPLQHDPSPHLCLSSPSQVQSSAATQSQHLHLRTILSSVAFYHHPSITHPSPTIFWCNPKNTHSHPKTHKLLSQCRENMFCSSLGPTNGTCVPILCRRDEFPFGFGGSGGNTNLTDSNIQLD